MNHIKKLTKSNDILLTWVKDLEQYAKSSKFAAPNIMMNSGDVVMRLQELRNRMLDEGLDMETSHEKKQARMKEIFDCYCDPTDWKAPIYRHFNKSELKHSIQEIKEAITFFVGEAPVIKEIEHTNIIRIESRGYRNGPAGP
jgi:endo-1,4-beta-mannosidase